MLDWRFCCVVAALLLRCCALCIRGIRGPGAVKLIPGRSGAQDGANRRLIGIAVRFPEKLPNLPSIAGVKKRCGDRSAPSRQNGADKGRLAPSLLAVIWKHGLIAGNKS